MRWRYLEEDPAAIALERQRELKGYELYCVEQWACSRKHPTFVIVTYTGDESHSVLVSVLSIPADEDAWSPRLRLYFTAAAQYHARKKQTPLGFLMVTNLSWFPSALNLIHVPDGNIKRHREDFYVNENLKRLGCAGRAGLTLAPPAEATQAKFYQLYKVSDQIRLCSAVIELVKLCQAALIMFAKLDSAYADGLLCDVTEVAINDWWADVGVDFYNSEPRDGILGPTTVAAMLGMLTGARNRLSAYGSPVPKDPFDIDGLKRGIVSFQKSQRIPRTRRLDRQTLDRLHRVTAKAASGEGWTVPKSVKSTVAEIGKRGDMVKGMVTAREKAGIAEVETLDFERFYQLVRGERCQWLWYGKPRKSMELAEAGKSFTEHTRHRWGGIRRDSFGVDSGKVEASDQEAGEDGRAAFDSEPGAVNEGAGDRDSHLRRVVLRSVTGKRSDGRSGLERIKDAVGLSGGRGRHHQSTKEDDSGAEPDGAGSKMSDIGNMEQGLKTVLSNGQSRSGSRGPDPHAPNAVTPIRTMMEAFRREREMEEAQPSATANNLPDRASKASANSSSERVFEHNAADEPEFVDAEDAVAAGDSRRGSAADEKDDLRLQEIPSRDAAAAADSSRGQQHSPRPGGAVLRRTESFSSYAALRRPGRDPNWWPRHLSFNAAEEALLPWRDIADDAMPEAATPGTTGATAAGADADADNTQSQRSPPPPPVPLVQSYLAELGAAQAAELRRARIQQLQQCVAAWAQRSLGAVEQLDADARRDLEQLYALSAARSREYQAALARVAALLPAQKAGLQHALRELEVRGAKLDYEVRALVAKAHDVADVLDGLERHVDGLEAKALDFEAEERSARDSWLRWALGALFGGGRHF